MSGYPTDPMEAPIPETNRLGTAGFVFSLAGLILGPFTLGVGSLLCPVGLVMSLVAMGRRPKGMAIAGVIIGALGLCLGAILVIVFAGLIFAALGFAFVAALTQAEKIEITADMMYITTVVQQYERENGALPESLDGLSIQTPNLLDPWGHEYDYIVDRTMEMGFDIISAGPDGVFDTEEDISLSRLDEAWATAPEDFRERVKELDSRGGARIRLDGDEEGGAEGEGEEAHGEEEDTGGEHDDPGGG